MVTQGKWWQSQFSALCCQYQCLLCPEVMKYDGKNPKSVRSGWYSPASSNCINLGSSEKIFVTWFYWAVKWRALSTEARNSSSNLWHYDRSCETNSANRWNPHFLSRNPFQRHLPAQISNHCLSPHWLKWSIAVAVLIWGCLHPPEDKWQCLEFLWLSQSGGLGYYRHPVGKGHSRC